MTDRSIQSEFRIRPATVDLLEAHQRDVAAFAAAIGCPVPAGWPEFPESVEFTIDRLRECPHEADWWMHLFLADGTLVGSGGFVGPPDHGVVEVGYEIAPEFRRRGYATAATRAMVAKAAAAGGAHTVIAHTLAEENPSTGVLRRVGFRFAGELPDHEQGAVWRWELLVG